MCMSYSNPCATLLDSQRSHSRPVDHASDGMIDCVPETTGRVLELKEVHSLSEYHDSLEQDYAKIAKSYADFTIRHYGSATTVVFDGCEEESPIKDGTHQRRVHTVASFTADSYISGKKEEFLSRDAYKLRLHPMNDM